MKELQKNPSAIVVGIALFSMFFGGGNLIFPLWIGANSQGFTVTAILGFLITGVLLPFLAVLVMIPYRGNYHKAFSVINPNWKNFFLLLILLFWIPLGSSPRCNNLAFAAFSEFGFTLSLWQYSGLYSLLVLLIAYKKEFVLNLLGYIITPLLLVSIAALIYSSVMTDVIASPGVITTEHAQSAVLVSAMISGYNTQDFIAAFFFTGAIITLIQSKGSQDVPSNLILKSGLLGVSLISIVYIGMIFTGQIHAGVLHETGKDQMLVQLARGLEGTGFNWVILSAITLSCISTSVALNLVFANYLEETIFKGRITYTKCLAISVALSFVMSTLGFASLSKIIEGAMSFLYPLLMVLSIQAWKYRKGKSPAPRVHEKKSNDQYQSSQITT